MDTARRHGRHLGDRALRYVHDRVAAWRTGSWQSQLYVLAVLAVGISVSWAVSWHSYNAVVYKTDLAKVF